MIPHPTTLHVVTDLRRKDLLVIAEHERLDSAVDGLTIFGLCTLALRRLPTGAASIRATLEPAVAIVLAWRVRRDAAEAGENRQRPSGLYPNHPTL